MDIEFDPDKDAINQAKHEGVSLAAAEFDKVAEQRISSKAQRDNVEHRWHGSA